MTILATIEDELARIAAVLGLDPVLFDVPTSPREAAHHFAARGDRFDMIHTERGKSDVLAERLGSDDVAYEVTFMVTMDHCLKSELKSRGPVYSRWNWIGPHIMMMRRAKPGWGARCEAHYRRVLEAAPLSDAEIDAILPGILKPNV